MGNHLYEENKRLKAEIERLGARLRERAQIDGEDQIDVLAREALKQILTGKAALVTTVGNDPDSRITYFQMLPVLNPDDGLPTADDVRGLFNPQT